MSDASRVESEPPGCCHSDLWRMTQLLEAQSATPSFFLRLPTKTCQYNGHNSIPTTSGFAHKVVCVKTEFEECTESFASPLQVPFQCKPKI